MKSNPGSPRDGRKAPGSSRRSADGSLADRVYRLIRGDILTCALAPGREVSEAELAERFRVSKTPVREALGILRSEGFVRTFPRRGYQVIPVTLSDVNQLFDLRGVLEGGAAELAVQRITEAELDELEALADVTYDRAEAPSLERFIRANREFHAAIARAGGNPRLCGLLLRHLDELERLFYLGARERDINTEVRSEHQRIAAVMRRRDPVAARTIMVEHALRTRAGLVAVLTCANSRAGFTL